MNPILKNVYSQLVCADYQETIDGGGWEDTWNRTLGYTRGNLFRRLVEQEWLTQEQIKQVTLFLCERELWSNIEKWFDNGYIHPDWDNITWKEITDLIELLGEPALCYNEFGDLIKDNSSED